MTLADTLMRKLADWRPGDAPRPVFSLSDPPSGAAVHVAFAQVDRLSGRVWEISATRAQASAAQTPALADWARQTAGRVTGLLEPLQLIELDADLGKAILRSSPPARKDGERFYYEVVLSREGTAEVRRYHGSCRTPGREQVPFTITHEALAKLIGDIVE